MTGRFPCDFSLIRYVPDPVKNEFVNIGVLLRPHAGDPAAAALRFTRDWSRVRCADPDADIEMLEAMEAEMRRRLPETAADTKPLLAVIDDSFSHLLQLTEPKACLAENFAAQMNDLMLLYVEPRHEKARPAQRGRQAIVRRMRAAFEHAQVWDLMTRRIAAARYTRPGDSLKIDCGYRPNGVVKMFHGVSLEGDAELAKVLAFSAPALREGVARTEKAELELTAIVEPLRENGEVRRSDEDTDQYRFAVETMEAQQIRVLTVSDLDRVAETARREMRV
ncbi:MAG TPA: DUF3037 domain-containing protein [Acidobacteriaceae bacterium]|nr:DUF3037 domain-containing protein [Acidobacteriaceae bacterium]